MSLHSLITRAFYSCHIIVVWVIILITFNNAIGTHVMTTLFERCKSYFYSKFTVYAVFRIILIKNLLNTLFFLFFQVPLIDLRIFIWLFFSLCHCKFLYQNQFLQLNIPMLAPLSKRTFYCDVLLLPFMICNHCLSVLD